MSKFDWEEVARSLTSDDWYLLGTDLPHTTATAIRQGSIKALRGAEVRTRKNRFDQDGRRFCDIYVKKGPQ